MGAGSFAAAFLGIGGGRGGALPAGGGGGGGGTIVIVLLASALRVAEVEGKEVVVAAGSTTDIVGVAAVAVTTDVREGAVTAAGVAMF